MSHNVATKIGILLPNSLGGNFWTLPQTPEIVTLQYPQNIVSNIVTNVGEIVQAGARRANRITFESTFPEHPDTFTIFHNADTWITPHQWHSRINSIFRVPVTLIITGLHIHGLYLVSNFRVSHSSGYDLDYHIEFIAYTQANVRTVFVDGVGVRNIQPNISPELITPSSPEAPTVSQRQFGNVTQTIYTVITGDTWSDISRKTGVSVQEILLQNRIPPSLVNSLKVGQKLVIRTRFIPNIQRTEQSSMISYDDITQEYKLRPIPIYIPREEVVATE